MGSSSLSPASSNQSNTISRAHQGHTLARNYSRFMTEPKQPAGPAMTLGDMRELRRWGGSST
jgi:hypothetical protein